MFSFRVWCCLALIAFLLGYLARFLVCVDGGDIKPDIILITESWCNNNISDNILNIDGYELISDLRRDRNDTTNGIGGGLLVFARKGLVILSIDMTNNFNQYINSHEQEFNNFGVNKSYRYKKDNESK